MYAFFAGPYKYMKEPQDGFGGPPVEDDGAILIARDESSDEDWPNGDFELPDVVLKTSLNELVDDCLDGWRNTKHGRTDEDFHVASDALAAALRAAADRLDAAK